MTRRRKRILLVDLGAAMGGVEVYIVGLAEILRPGADVYALCVLKDLEDRLRTKGVSVARIPAFSRLKILKFVAAVIVLCIMIVRFRIQVVQINGFLESVLIVPARLLGCEAVYTRHGPFETELYKWYKKPGKFLPRILSRYLASLSSRLVCVSEAVGAVYKPVSPSGITVIPNWVSHFPEYKRKAIDDARQIHIIYVGRLERYKGLHLLLEAIRDIPDVSLTVVGDGAYREALQQLASGLNVTFVGFQSDPTEFYEAADIFVMPSLGPEGLPLVTLEAMSHGLACLFSDLPVHREITDEGHAALLFRSGDVDDLRIKLKALIGSVPSRVEYSQNAYRQIQSKYSLSVAREAYLKLFQVSV
jgi:glycosyltransferase involved in cell wall biosynthesis